MADDKNKKDEIEENLDQDAGDIHEADDTFGLPDIDFNPVEPETPEEKESEPVQPAEEETVSETPYNEEIVEEPAEEPVSEPEPEVEQPYMYASRDEDEPVTPAEDSSPFTDTAEETTDEPVYHATESEEPETVASTDYSASVEEEHIKEEEKSAYVPGSYSSREESSNKAGVIIGVLLVVILALAAVWYFVWYSPGQEAEEKARQEQLAEERAAEEERQRQLEAEQQAAAEEAARQAEADAAAAAVEEEPETGTIETISQRTGRYYVVVASAVDGDLAMDYANKLSAEGRNVKIIQPYGSVIFHRVTIQDLDTWAEAQNVANELKGEYGDGVWVKKY